MKQLYCLPFLTIFLILSLVRCTPVFMGTAIGVAGTVAVYDRQTIHEMAIDWKISRQMIHQLKMHPELTKNSHIAVTTYHQVVLLVGQAPTMELIDQAETLARSVPNIKRLYNEISIGGPTSHVTRANDAWLTTKVKSVLLATTGLESGQIKVLTEDSAVFLMGMVSRSQADLAVQAIKNIHGVKKVVKIFQYTS